MRVLLDSTILVAAFTTRGLCADVVRVVLTDHSLVVGEVNVREVRRVLSQRMKVPADVVARVENRSYNEIARLMGVSVGTVGTYLHRARNELKGMLR